MNDNLELHDKHDKEIDEKFLFLLISNLILS